MSGTNVHLLRRLRDLNSDVLPCPSMNHRGKLKMPCAVRTRSSSLLEGRDLIIASFGMRLGTLLASQRIAAIA